jgi:nickel/cobalt exporter
MLNQLLDIQRTLYASLSGHLTAFSESRDWLMLAAVLPLGVIFGAVHAVMPGHGKGLLASYLVGSRLAVLKALAVAGVQALTHVGSAVFLALIAAPLIIRTLPDIGRAPALEFLSRGMLIAIGAWLMFRAIRGHQHPKGEGLAVGFIAGLIPCPLTLFAMFFALNHGVPEAGVWFAIAMMLGVAFTLSIVALLTVLARETIIKITTRHGTSLHNLGRVLDGLSGLLLMAIAAYELWR